jgi:hypothetical protein
MRHFDGDFVNTPVRFDVFDLAPTPASPGKIRQRLLERSVRIAHGGSNQLFNQCRRMRVDFVLMI